MPSATELMLSALYLQHVLVDELHEQALAGVH